MTDHAFVHYAGDGSSGPFAIPFPYLDRAHIVVRVDGVLTPATFAGDAAVQLGAPAAVGAVVEIRRETPRDHPLVDFTDGAVLTESDLDRAILQQLYIAQETHDRLDAAVTLGADGAYDFAGRRAGGLAAPVTAEDAATKAYADAQSAAAAAAVSAAQAWAEQAENIEVAAGAYSARHHAAKSAASAAEAASEAAAASVAAATLGVPAGGASGQVLAKVSGADHDADWANPVAAVGGAGAVQVSNGIGGFTGAADALVWDQTNNRLGIGIAAPAQPLDIVTGEINGGIHIWGPNTGVWDKAAIQFDIEGFPNRFYRLSAGSEVAEVIYHIGGDNSGRHIFRVGPGGGLPALSFDEQSLVMGHHFPHTHAGYGKAQIILPATDKGFLLNRLTTAQKLAISSPPEGLVVYDTDLSQIAVYDGAAWRALTHT